MFALPSEGGMCAKSDGPACVKIQKNAFTMKFFGFWLNSTSLDAMEMDEPHTNNIHRPDSWYLLTKNEKESFFEDCEEWDPGYLEEVDVKTYQRIAYYGFGLDGLGFLFLPEDCVGVVIISLPYDEYMKFYPKFHGLNCENLVDDVTVGDLRCDLKEKTRYISSLPEYNADDDYFEKHCSKIRKTFFPIQHQEIYSSLSVAHKLVSVGEQKNDLDDKKDVGKKRTPKRPQETNKKKRRM